MTIPEPPEHIADQFPERGIDFIADTAHDEAIQKLSQLLVARKGAELLRAHAKHTSDNIPNDIDRMFSAIVDRLNRGRK